MTAIMLYILILSSGVAVAALIAERTAAALDLPKRQVWLCALLASTCLPVLGLATGGHTGATSAAEPLPLAGAATPTAAASTTEPATAASGSSGLEWQQWAAWSDWAGWRLLDGTVWPAAAALNNLLAALWLTASAILLFAYLAAWLSVRRQLHRWPRTRIDGAEVCVSDRVGPAVFGLVQPRIIIPQWVLRESGWMQTAVIRHERAHAAAKDTWWLAAATLAVALVPWNPVVWWQLQRLRTAIELDCDARVVGAGMDAEAYARVLVAVAERQMARERPLPLPGAVFSTARRSQLERRVRHLIVRPASNRRAALLGSACTALLLWAAWSIEPPAMAQLGAPGMDTEGPRETAVARQPLTGLASGGERVLVLVDVSAGMLDRTVEGVQRWLEVSPDERRRAPKWAHLVETVGSVTAQIPSDAQFQMIVFNDDARAVIPGTDGQWLTATPSLIDGSVDLLRTVVLPEGRSSLRAAFDAASSLEPPPDTVHLIVDGLPTAGNILDAASGSEYERMHQLQSAIESVPPDAAVNVVLMPREGDAIAAAAYWVLTHRTGGALFAPVEGEVRSAVPGVPLDADYLVFVVDTSGSMLNFGWVALRNHLRELLELHPPVRGIQLLTDMGEPRLPSYRDTWIPDTPDTRRDIIDALQDWRAFSNSTPREGILAAMDQPREAGSKLAVYVYGDDIASGGIGEIDSMLEQLESMHLDPDADVPRMRINAVALPALLEATGELHSSATYAMLMRELSLRTGGTFIALPE